MLLFFAVLKGSRHWEVKGRGGGRLLDPGKGEKKPVSWEKHGGGTLEKGGLSTRPSRLSRSFKKRRRGCRKTKGGAASAGG